MTVFMTSLLYGEQDLRGGFSKVIHETDQPAAEVPQENVSRKRSRPSNERKSFTRLAEC